MSTATEGTPPYVSNDTASPEERAAQLRVIEEEIRRQVVNERAANLAATQQQPWVVELPPRDSAVPKRVATASTWDQAATQQQTRLRKPSRLEGWKQRGGLLGGIASLLLLLLKIGGPVIGLLLKAKFLVTLGTALLAVVLQAWAYGWPMAIGLVSVVLIHECGHSYATWRKGLPVKGIYIIPFLGGLAVGGSNGNPRDEAYIGIMGPVFGASATFASVALFTLTHQHFFLVLAHISFAIHLMNMIPVKPFDGSWVMGLFGKGPRQAAFRITDADRRTYGLIYAGMATLFLVGSIALAAAH